VNWPWNGIRGGFFHHPIIIIVVIESSVKCNLWILRTLANRLPTGFQYASIKPTKNYNKEEKAQSGSECYKFHLQTVLEDPAATKTGATGQVSAN